MIINEIRSKHTLDTLNNKSTIIAPIAHQTSTIISPNQYKNDNMFNQIISSQSPNEQEKYIDKKKQISEKDNFNTSSQIHQTTKHVTPKIINDTLPIEHANKQILTLVKTYLLTNPNSNQLYKTFIFELNLALNLNNNKKKQHNKKFGSRILNHKQQQNWVFQILSKIKELEFLPWSLYLSLLLKVMDGKDGTCCLEILILFTSSGIKKCRGDSCNTSDRGKGDTNWGRGSGNLHKNLQVVLSTSLPKALAAPEYRDHYYSWIVGSRGRFQNKLLNSRRSAAGVKRRQGGLTDYKFLYLSRTADLLPSDVVGLFPTFISKLPLIKTYLGAKDLELIPQIHLTRCEPSEDRNCSGRTTKSTSSLTLIQLNPKKLFIYS
jgi:hypothetical protein